jgi:hypothetical protein
MGGTAGRMTLGGIAASLVIGLAACGNAVAGAESPAKPAAATPAATEPAAGQINPGGPMVPATVMSGVVLCGEIPRLTRMVFTRATAWPPNAKQARRALPGGTTIRDAATVRRIATLLCTLPAVKAGLMSCPIATGGSYRLYFAAPGRPIPTVGIQLSGCRTVTGLGPVRTWATSKQLEQGLSHGFGTVRPLSPLP